MRRCLCCDNPRIVEAMHTASRRVVKGETFLIKDIVCTWCSVFCSGKACHLQQAEFIFMRTKKRNNCARCNRPIECQWQIYWHPEVRHLAMHDECGDQEGLRAIGPDPNLSVLEGAYC